MKAAGGLPMLFGPPTGTYMPLLPSTLLSLQACGRIFRLHLWQMAAALLWTIRLRLGNASICTLEASDSEDLRFTRPPYRLRGGLGTPSLKTPWVL